MYCKECPLILHFGTMVKKRFSSTLFFQNKAHILAVLLCSLTFPLLFLTRASEQSGDSLSYAFSAMTGSEMFHPHHLLYTPLIHILSRAASRICERCDVICVAQIHNVVCALVTVICFYYIARYVLDSTWAGFCASLSFLVTRGFWCFTTQVEVYVPALSFLAIIMVIMVGRCNVDLSLKEIVMISILLAISVFFHPFILIHNGERLRISVLPVFITL